jgi:hypothetical protein
LRGRWKSCGSSHRGRLPHCCGCARPWLGAFEFTGFRRQTGKVGAAPGCE